jgi:putative ABC transport system permease protein
VFHLTPFWDVHLTSDRYGGMTPAGSWLAVYGFAVTALLIILVACGNFTNLATARATMRRREISLRKVAGATRRELIVQFLIEALLTALASFVIALALVEILLPAYGRFLDAPIQFHYLADWRLLLTILAGAIVSGLLGGIYPAFILSSFQPAASLKATGGTQGGSGLIRSALVISQFAISIGLGIVTIVVFSQINYARKIDLGFTQEDIVVVRDVMKLTPSARESFVLALKANPQIIEVALSNSVPFDLRNASNVPIKIDGSTQSFTAHIINISPEFTSLYGMHLVAGRLLSRDHGEDVFSPETGGNVLVNADAIRRSGYTNEQALGKIVSFGKGRRVRVVGVLADSMFDGMRDSVVPTVYWDVPSEDTMLSVRVRAGGLTEALSHIDATWRSFAPNAAIQRYFLTEVFDSMFEADQKQGAMLGVFVAIAIFIACLGLFGLTIFTAARRTKEIGIRKVFGARTSDLVRLLLWKIASPVLIANIIAWPAAYYYLDRWLEGYAYRISLEPMYFLIASTVALAIACVTVFAHVLRLVLDSPIHALRYE